MRVSSYIIPTQVDNDQYMLVHGYSGAIDIVDTYIARFLFMNKDADDISLHNLDKEIIDHLIKRGYLTSMTPYGEYEYVERMINALHKKTLLTDANFTFVVSYDCNFRCAYCFEKSDGWKLKNHTMSVDNVDKAYSVIDKLRQERPMAAKTITLFGGEPLLKDNLPIIEYIINEGMKRGIVFGAITNGYDIDHFEHLLSKNMICKLQITLDGYDEIHNMKRPHKDKVPTFFHIIDNIKLALRRNISVAVRLNLDKTNQDEASKLQNYFRENGFLENANFHFSVARLINHDSRVNSDTFFTQQEFNSHFNKSQLSQLHLQDFSIESMLHDTISKGTPLYYKSTFCKSQIAGYTFDPLYNIYPCWEVVGNPGSVIGSYSSGEVNWNVEIRDQWHNTTALSNESCAKCPGILLCGGGCLSKIAKAQHCTHVPQLINTAAKKIYNTIKQTK